LYVTHIRVMVIADLLLKAKKTSDYSAKAFQSLEKLTLDYTAMHDRLTANSIKSWSNYKLWRVEGYANESLRLRRRHPRR